MKTEQKIYHTLRIASAMCLIGHGAFGIITKAVWCNYLAVIGIGQDTAYTLMPVIGSADILMGLSLLFYPVRAVFLWLVIWGLATASMRPLSGEPFAELLERAGNFGAPLAVLILYPPEKGFRAWFKKIQPPGSIPPESLKKLKFALQLTAFLLLAGHGWLNLTEKKGLLAQYESLGFNDVHTVAHAAGLFELMAAISILIHPLRPLIMLFLIWKIGTELFYPQWEIFEWIERGGSYGTLLALWFSSGYFSIKIAERNRKLTSLADN
ncbi:hypothetical protein [Pedobacter ginsengisoli]|uniref:hypothetical protein n=1 Tax=Pedobacter ginsengisoli TaxID=363852 RepID=UPI00255194BB|nr:hypothetical protein [Pedobacter ginsengisoli]